MLDHHIQRSVIHRLAFMPAASFSELKADGLDNKLFTYHLKKTVSAGYVQKSEDGLYSLTPEGRRLSTGVLEKQQELIVERPLSAMFLIIRRQSDQAWLLYRRKTHPMLDYSGFMHCRPNAAESILETARGQVLKKTGLDCSFHALGGGYVRIFDKENLESFTHFTLLYCNEATGELKPDDEHAEYFWEQNPDFASSKMFPTTPVLKDFYEHGKPFYSEQSFTI